MVGSREEIEHKIKALGDRLTVLDKPEDKRIRKRILQQLGKLKKELAALPEQPVAQPAQFSKKEGKLKVKLLNAELAELAVKKNLKQAKSAVNRALKKGLKLNIHSYSNLLNVYVRCSEIAGADILWRTMLNQNLQPNVVTYTTMIKGYCQAHKMESAYELIKSIPASIGPNIRTVNTFLRGCVHSGDVDYAVDVFNTFRSRVVADSSTIEYVVHLLCQSLDVEAAKAVMDSVSHFSDASLHAAGGTAPLDNPAIYIALATAFILLGDRSQAQHYIEIAEGKLQESASAALRQNMTARAQAEGDFDEDRTGSITYFLKHRHEDLTRQHAALKEYLGGEMQENDKILQLLSRVFLCPQDSSIPVTTENLQKGILSQLVSKFGYSRIPCTVKGLSQRLLENLMSCFMRPSGTLDYSKVFEASESKKRKHSSEATPVRLELGAGSGDWVVHRAQEEKGRANWIAVELKYDRVHEIFTKAAFKQVSNLVIVGGDANVVLDRLLSKESIDMIFINHPEPPERSMAGDRKSAQGKHMLTNDFLSKLLRILVLNGRLIITTDNKNYSQLLLDALPAVHVPNDDKEWRFEADDAYAANHEDKESSYFDRMWNTGYKKKRWTLCYKKFQLSTKL